MVLFSRHVQDPVGLSIQLHDLKHWTERELNRLLVSGLSRCWFHMKIKCKIRNYNVWGVPCPIYLKVCGRWVHHLWQQWRRLGCHGCWPQHQKVRGYSLSFQKLSICISSSIIWYRWWLTIEKLQLHKMQSHSRACWKIVWSSLQNW